jgi:ferredoxin
MNCGFCAEFCPFDAIKMDHNYELASYDRTHHHIHDKPHLSKPHTYWKTIAPTTALEEAVERGGWEHSDTLKGMKKAGQQAVAPTKENMFPVQVAPVAVAETPAKQERPAKPEAAPVEAKPAAPATEASAADAPKKPKFDKQAMLAKIREKKGG